MKKILLLVVIVSVCLSLNYVIMCPQAHAKTYKIAMTHWVGFSPLNVADAKGFWKEQGVDVQVVNNVDVGLITKQVETKEVDLGMHMMGTWVSQYMDNVPITIIAETDWSSGGDKIIAKKNLDVSQLKGKPVGTYDTTPAIAFFLNKYLAANNLKIADVKMVQFDPENLADNFITGRFNLIVNFDPQALRAENSGQGKTVATSATYPGCIPEGIAARNDVLKEMPKEDLAKILRGWLKAVTWCQDSANWKEYVQILNTKTFEGEAPYSEEDIKGMMGAVKLHDPQASAERNKKDGGLCSYLKEVKDFLSGNGLLKKDFRPEDLFDNTVISEVVQGG